jgi:hypothetical protein
VIADGALEGAARARVFAVLQRIAIAGRRAAPPLNGFSYLGLLPSPRYARLAEDDSCA